MSQSHPSAETTLSETVSYSMHDYWRLLMAEGVILNLLGLAAIFMPNLAGLVVIVCLGWLFLASGVVGLIFTLKAKQTTGYVWSLLSALVATLAGALLLWSPLEAMATLTEVLTGFFIVEGIVTIALALSHRRKLSGKWEWMIVNGIVDLILAAIIISGLPGTLVWIFGLLVGIDMIFGGASLIGMAWAARKDDRTQSTPVLP